MKILRLNQLIATALLLTAGLTANAGSWIRINQLGYIPNSTKVAVFVSDEELQVTRFEIVDAFTDKTVLRPGEGKIRQTGELGRLKSTARLDFSELKAESAYRIVAWTKAPGARKESVTRSDIFPVNGRVYDGTATNGDYTTPDMKNYYSSDYIMERIWNCEASDPDGLNGHILLIHLGTSDLRMDKFYDRLDELIEKLLARGYSFTALK